MLLSMTISSKIFEYETFDADSVVSFISIVIYLLILYKKRKINLLLIFFLHFIAINFSLFRSVLKQAFEISVCVRVSRNNINKILCLDKNLS